MVGCASSRTSTRVGDVEVRTFRRAYSNVHIVEKNGVRVMVDSGYGEEAAGLDAELKKAGVEPRTIAAIIVTHAHADHAGGARFFHDHYGTRIVAGAADRDTFAAGHNGHMCPVGTLGRWRYAKDSAGTFAPLTADLWIDAPTTLQAAGLGNIDGKIIPMPSHTPGSLAVVIGDVALVGDLFRGSALGHGAEVHFFMCDLAANRADVGRLLVDPAPRTFFPGHFGPVARAAVERRFTP
jgi:glyoxylase-like metal-dependent hydrolase (beta-lactamase superfamily II)